MARIIFSDLADADANDIIRDLGGKAGVDVAERYVADFDRLYRQLAAFPESCARRPALGSNVRMGVVYPYVIFYEYSAIEDVVTIMRLLHGRRRITRKMMRGG